MENVLDLIEGGLQLHFAIYLYLCTDCAHSTIIYLPKRGQRANFFSDVCMYYVLMNAYALAIIYLFRFLIYMHTHMQIYCLLKG